ncbi:aminoglycoside adenylyltransferase domain-containing protein [Bacillus sp. EB01]|uniref:aminoglycoside adenylyltransferase domain-containing protein n=1 Tax=Bacillus sp. EB01 TaxID=1347086 RepID=UPI0005C4DA71|nr:aminoglycoside adenylyltransferase domain-containing protein [Bacillus sp. EB01]
MGIPSIVDTVLKEYINLFYEHFPETMEGLYIHGSIALNSYVDDSSDIDFITVTNRPLTEKDSDALSFIHSHLAKKYKKPEMDGVYILWEDLGKLNQKSNDVNYNYPFYNNKKLSFGNYFNFNPVTWWVFEKKGINILGTDPRDFQFDIQPQELFSYVLENMNTYWVNRIQKAEDSIDDLVKLPTDEIDFEIEWIVLGLLRQFYTLKEFDIVSKLGAGEYGLTEIAVEWHDIIKEAMNLRMGIKAKIFKTEMERMAHTIRFSKFLIRLCNNIIECKLT